MNFSLISILLMIIQCKVQILEKWDLNEIWESTYTIISLRNNSSFGVIDLNNYIQNSKLIELEDNLKQLNSNYEMNIFIIIIKEFKEKFICEKFLNYLSFNLFLNFETSNFDIKHNNIISIIFSVENELFVIAIGNNYKKRIIFENFIELNNEIKLYLHNKEISLGIEKLLHELENSYQNLSHSIKADKKQEKKENKSNDKQNIKYNDTNKIISLYFIIIIFVVLVIYFILKMIKRLKFLNSTTVDYNIMNTVFET